MATAEWEKFPSYLDVCVPRFLEFFKTRGWKITVFVVGQDARVPNLATYYAPSPRLDTRLETTRSTTNRGCTLYDDEKLDRELRTVTTPLPKQRATFPPASAARIQLFRQRSCGGSLNGYDYDASTFPTFIGPLARLYYFMASRLSKEQKRNASCCLGPSPKAFVPWGPYYWA